MGYGTAVSITAVGDSVNTASRLESLCKTYACELMVSEAVVLRAGVDLGAAPRHEIEIRGRVEQLVVRPVTSARDLPVLERAARPTRKVPRWRRPVARLKFPGRNQKPEAEPAARSPLDPGINPG
jgi:class 3 adenylate cyclase